MGETWSREGGPVSQGMQVGQRAHPRASEGWELLEGRKVGWVSMHIDSMLQPDDFFRNCHPVWHARL